MSKKPNNLITIDNISISIVEAGSHLEKIVGKKLFIKIYDKKMPEPFWRIGMDERLYITICTIHYYRIKKAMGLWCNYENCTPNIYNELNKQLQNLSRKFGLNLENLNQAQIIKP